MVSFTPTISEAMSIGPVPVSESCSVATSGAVAPLVARFQRVTDAHTTPSHRTGVVDRNCSDLGFSGHLRAGVCC
jgi:hypothetical protein